jgi:hypothetical protein
VPEVIESGDFSPQSLPWKIVFAYNGKLVKGEQEVLFSEASPLQKRTWSIPASVSRTEIISSYKVVLELDTDTNPDTNSDLVKLEIELPVEPEVRDDGILQTSINVERLWALREELIEALIDYDLNDEKSVSETIVNSILLRDTTN